jgi:alpha-tubulin suppressor-like RCC1 family protein
MIACVRGAHWLLAVTACTFEPGRAPIGIDSAGTCRATTIAASSAHTCAALADGRVRCWGKNGQGELARDPATSPDNESCVLGTTSHVCIKRPIDANMPVSATALGMGDQHSCAIGAGGKVFCWGANDSGQFGSGLNGDEYAPYEVSSREGATAIAGGNTHTCSLEAGVLSCSGGNAEGEVANGTTGMVFTPYASEMGVTVFGVGYENVYAIVGSSIRAWGKNDTRQVDNTGMSPRTTPITVSGISNAAVIAGGLKHVCAVLMNSAAACWGENLNGQLGRATVTAEEPPGAVSITTEPISELTAGVNHTCVRFRDKRVMCFGEQYALAGEVIALPGPAAQITSGSYHDCALLEDGTVWCWGWNAYGQFGDGTSGDIIDPTPHQAQVCR